ncbi:MAG: YifB family Mg chelatase-like AAA ATPase [Spirochaetales bacterium]|nr:YifB family Mg chelatase-like AAA ATPase [Spirochaetales bacterium]
MLSNIASHALVGLEGEIISVEVDIRRGMPGIDMVGLPDNAMREAKERVRVAIRNSGFEFPHDRILVSLAPAGMRKGGASFDLPIALGILAASGQVDLPAGCPPLVLGELNLSGRVRPIHGVIAAVEHGLGRKLEDFLIPADNLTEARILGRGNVCGITDLAQAALLLTSGFAEGRMPEPGESAPPESPPQEAYGDLADLKGHLVLKRALEIAVAGRHHLLLFGPPGSGKTMAARRLPGILPPLSAEESLEVTRIHSVAGTLDNGGRLITRPPFRAPHHSASLEGVIGGGKWCRPGEVSLAHRGVLFLDEAPEFRRGLMQSLREPIEQQSVTIVRADQKVSFPSSFQLVLTANPCPCGNLGRQDKVCLCSPEEVNRYWRRLGGALLDRVDIRVPVKPVRAYDLTGSRTESSDEVRERIERVAAVQAERYRGLSFSRNGQLPAGLIEKYCPLDGETLSLLSRAVEKLSLSSRAFHSILKIARTIADLEGEEKIGKEALLEAVQHRRYGEENAFWGYG